MPHGTTVLEASAGTGKTYTIAALAARYIAEGRVRLDQLMLITFGRMATNELRMRVRERLVRVDTDLAPGRPPADDPVSRLLADGTPAEVAERRANIARALADFDAATIATTHEFCQQMLAGLGVLGDREPDAVFVDNLTDLTREVASDTYLRGFASDTRVPPFTFDQALTIAERAVGAPHAELVPQDDQGVAGVRVRFGQAVRAEVRRRKERARLFTYDDMLTRLQQVLAEPRHGAAAAQRLRDRYRIVLVDEFQDTDPIQWDILRRAFHGHSTLILIGDPKQAIYAFRGADVFSYLDAVREAGTLATLDTNWRSDAALVDAFDVLLGEAALGDAAITVRPVQAANVHRRLVLPRSDPSPGAGDPGDQGTLSPAPVRIRVLSRDRAARKLPSVGSVRPRIAADLVADVSRLLSAGAVLELPNIDRRSGRAHPAGSRPLNPSDIAVLVRRNSSGEQIRAALAAAGIPAVLMGAGSVFSSTLAQEWLTLLTALEQPRQANVRKASLTCFFGWSFARLAEADDEELTELSQTIRLWAKILSRHGVAALLEAITSHTRLAERLLGEVGGERRLTDLRHIGQSLHAAMVSTSLGVNALVAWLRQRMEEAQVNSLNDRTRRLETDADAVQILTVHRSKGLEFPVVYLPEAWDRHVGDDDGQPLSLHQPVTATATAPAGAERCVLDLGGRSGPGRSERLGRYRHEDAGEELRLLYVALTRAQCQVVTWWAPTRNTPSSSLQRFLFGPRRAGVEPALTYEVDDEPFTLRHLAPPLFSVEELVPRDPVTWQPPVDGTLRLQARRLTRQLDVDWRRTSYSALTAAAHGVDLSIAGVGSEAEAAKEDDESPVAEVLAEGLGLAPQPSPASPGASPFAVVSPMNDLPSGAQFGTVVHAVLERIDPTSPDLSAEVATAVAEQLGRGPSGPLTVEALTEALLPSLRTPLGPLADGLRLCDIATTDRLAELDFEFPLAGGEHPTTELRLGQIVPLLRRHLGSTDPLADYPDRIAHPLLADQSLRGYLNGSIDAVLRLGQTQQAPRYVVVDYKTNWLGDFGAEPLTLGHYAPPLLSQAMMQAHYPLQALLYSVAVHRFLRWRQPGYDPAVHLGGVLYLFLRGMGGPDTPMVDAVPCGVFSWLPPPALVTELSDLLDRGAPQPEVHR
nr:UvrD-helicase domain-containing protein [Microlunatus panaciterrae]